MEKRMQYKQANNEEIRKKLEIHWTQARLCTSNKAEKNGLKHKKTITNKKMNLINCKKSSNSLKLMLWPKKHLCQRW